VPATVTYSGATFRAQISPHDKLGPARDYRIEVTAGVKDAGSNPVVATSSTFTTGTASFTDTAGNTFEAEIEWLVATGATNGCSAEKFCPAQTVPREQMAAFLVRALDLPAASGDHFSDDGASPMESEINRLATAGLTGGCAPSKFCPRSLVTRAQMATFLARALNAPPTTTDFFSDDDGNTHEDSINRLAAAGIVGGCAEDSYCPMSGVTRGQMAAFLYRALGGD